MKPDVLGLHSASCAITLHLCRGGTSQAGCVNTGFLMIFSVRF